MNTQAERRADVFVMKPSALTKFLLDHLSVQPGAVAVDLGCGCGALAVAAVKLGAARCWAVDLNPDAVYATYEAAWACGLSDRIIPVVASIEGVDKLLLEEVDLVVSNPPQLPQLTGGASRSKREMAYDGGQDGRKYVDMVIATAAALLRRSRHLSPELYMVTTSVVGVAATFAALAAAGFKTEIVSEREEAFRPVYLERLSAMHPENYRVRDGVYFETLYVLRSRFVKAV